LIIISEIPNVKAIFAGRYAHNANLIDSRIYYLGGIDERDKLLDDFFFLDVSGGTNFNDYSFQNFPVDRANPGISWGATITTQHSIIYLYGGLKANNEVWQLANNSYSIDVKNSPLWTEKEIPLETGPAGRRSMTSIIDKAGIMYVFGGSNQTINGVTRGNYDRTMYKFDTATGLWSQAPLRTSGIDSTTLPGFDYSATLLDDGKNIYIGGQLANGVYLDMNKIWSYNTINDQWTLNRAGGISVTARASHSAVLANDRTSIIIYGGWGEPNPITDDQALIILDTTTWTWSKPSITNPSLTRHAHTATLYKNYMIVAFGAHQDKFDSQIISSNFISILDISKFKWVTSIDNNQTNSLPNNQTSNPPSSSSDNSGSRLAIIIGASAAGFVGFTILIIAGVLLYRHLDQKKMNERAEAGMSEVVVVQPNII
ncbi:7241_t:CDS:2, partial [Ambispora gerdemannii]